jgi:hypothetical protein
MEKFELNLNTITNLLSVSATALSAYLMYLQIKEMRKQQQNNNPLGKLF